jgi:hypothetical protein
MVATRISRATISARGWGSIVPYGRSCRYGKFKSAHTVWRLIPHALERAAADAHNRSTDFILSFVSHLHRARPGATNHLCPALAKNIGTYSVVLPILLNLQESRV